MKQNSRYLFFSIFLGIIIGTNIYLPSRFNFYFGIESGFILYLLFPSLTVFMIFGVLPLSNSTSRFGSLLYKLAASTMGILLYLLISVLLVDIIHLFTNFPLKIYGLSALGIAFLFSFFGIINAWNIRITQKEISIKGLTKEIRAMHLSDIHLGHFRGKKFLQKIVEKTKQQNVDVVFLTGDLFDGRIRLSWETLEPLTQLKAPVFFIEGNHDKYTGVKEIKNLLREMGIRVLENEMENRVGLQIIGLNHMAADNETFNMHASSNGHTIKSTLAELSPKKNKPTVLLHHSPDGIKYASEHGVDLYLAGHTHAGQLFPIKYLADLIFDYNKGMHNFNGTTIFVSQGAGTFGPPMRVGTKSEITLIQLKPRK
ncbi:MAG TPA: metallophosphoesterase [Draconibacterium sp.]|nr:metallophosphoesterase [Draconibacterium sp.]